MKIGDLRLDVVETGGFLIDGGAMFGVVPKALWSRSHDSDHLNRVELVSRSLLIRGHGKTILVDTGCGDSFSDKRRDIYGFNNTIHSLEKSLGSLGVSRKDVTDVILTHLHFDHVGGAIVSEGTRLLPAFPRARYYVQRKHWEHALEPTEKDRASFLPETFMPLQEHGVLELLDGEKELWPGVSVIVLHGHTTAQQIVKVTSGGTTVLFSADLLAVPAFIRLPYLSAFDLRPLESLKEKKKVLSQAAKEKWLLFFQHDPKVIAATVKAVSKGYEMDQAVDWK